MFYIKSKVSSILTCMVKIFYNKQIKFKSTYRKITKVWEMCVNVYMYVCGVSGKWLKVPSFAK